MTASILCVTNLKIHLMQPSTSCHIRQRSVWTVDVAVVGVTKFDDRNAALLYGSGLSWPFISD